MTIQQELLAQSTVIMLAAGKSERMGMPKGLLKIKGTTWLSWQMQKMREVGIKKLVCVLGYNYEEYYKEMPDIKVAEGTWTDFNGLKLLIVINPKPEYGPFSSLKEAVVTLNKRGELGNLFVMPIDVPCAEADLWLNLCPENIEAVDAAYPVVEKKGAHPMFVAKSFAEKILKTDAHAVTARLDFLVATLPKNRVVKVNSTDKNIMLNFNELKTWQAYLAQISTGK